MKIGLVCVKRFVVCMFFCPCKACKASKLHSPVFSTLYIHTYIHTHAYIHTCIHIYIYIYVNVNIYIYI